jgi:PAT family beta-lactamase induction signal transducer AmpG
MVIWVMGTAWKDLGHTDAEITVATASVGIAWSLKPLWAAFLDMARTKKFFVIAMELLLAALLAGCALTFQLPDAFSVISIALWGLAFASATQDICVDGVYITALDERQQAAWVGVQGMCWNAGRFFATAGVVGLASWLEQDGGDPRRAWMIAVGAGAAAMALLAAWHRWVMPTGSVGERPDSAGAVVRGFVDSVRAFLAKRQLAGMLAFVFLYRTGEGFLLVEAPLFMQAPVTAGGLGLTLAQKAFLDGTIGTVVSIIGGLLGAAVAARLGLRRVLVALALCMNIPHLCYVVLAYGAPLPLGWVQVLVAVEKLGYSFGFVGNMLYMMQQLAPGKYKMTHYAFATALMNLVLVPTQMASGPLADWLGYRHFFVFVLVASIPSVIAAWFAPFTEPEAEEAAR